jgi:hypothetical protein
LGLSVSHEGKGLVQFEMPSGQLFEVFGSENRYFGLHARPVLGFQVEDVRRARMELASLGVKFRSGLESVIPVTPQAVGVGGLIRATVALKPGLVPDSSGGSDPVRWQQGRYLAFALTASSSRSGNC